VRENAQDFNVSFEQELNRVMAHGVLHLCGFGDKTPEEVKVMRKKEDEALHFLHEI
jgi:rRNA maturation RNase YbeY